MTAATKPVRLPPITEAEFMRQISELALMFGWDWCHFRPAQTSRGWRTPVSGTLGQGWPDLVLVKAGKYRGGPGEVPGRILFVELKRDGAKTTPDQDRVLGALDMAGAETYVWRPADLEEVMAVLR